ncbi:MAG: DUF3592 domain-containing protein [Leptolinea sp.]
MNINFGTLIPILIGILAGGSGCAFLVLAWQRKRTEAITKSWQPAPGIILTSEVKEHKAVDPAQVNKTVFTPMVRFQYSCAGKSYTGYRITFNPVEYSQSKAQKIATRFLPGIAVTVFYDPLHPEEAVLERNTRGFNFLFSTGLVLFALGIGSCFISLLVFWIGKAVR